MLYAITALFAFQLLGEAIVQLTGLPLPGALMGTLLLHGRLPESLEKAAGVLLLFMMLLFIPVIAGVMLEFDRLSREWQPFVIACVAGAAITFLATAFTFRWCLERQRAREAAASQGDKA